MKENLRRLEEIQSEIQELVEEAQGLLPADSMIARRAESYWIPHILTALRRNNGDFLGGSMTTMEETIGEIAEAEE